MEENVSIRLTLPKELVNQLPDDREELNTFVAEAIKNALRRQVRRQASKVTLWDQARDPRVEAAPAGKGKVQQVGGYHD